MPASENIVKAVGVTAELMGTTFTKEAARVFCDDLEGYDEASVMNALERCRKEVRGRLTLADVINRIDYGHIGPEEAWALCPKSEAESVVWTEQIATAYFAALPLLEEGDRVAARMAFLENYRKAIETAKRNHIPAQWYASLGWDAKGRESVIEKARALGRLPAPQHFPAIEAKASGEISETIAAITRKLTHA